MPTIPTLEDFMSGGGQPPGWALLSLRTATPGVPWQLPDDRQTRTACVVLRMSGRNHGINVRTKKHIDGIYWAVVLPE